MLHPPVRIHCPNVPLDDQQKLDEEISRLEAHLISLKLTRNALSPVAQLHPEILQEIFFLTHISSPQFSRGKVSLTLTWVSHTWRELARSTSDLWIYVDFNHTEWIQAAISLTRDRELSLNLDFASHAHGRMAPVDWHSSGPFYLSHLPRTKTLEIHSKFRRYLKAIPDWATPAPVLEELILHSAAISPNIFSGICPRLRILRLSACWVDWATLTLPVFTGLTDLDIFWPERGITVRHFIDILGSIALTLERLKFSNLLGSSESTPAAESGRVRLKTLKMLSIDEHNSDSIREFFNQISVPPKADTEIGVPWDQALLETLASCKNISGWETDRLEANTAGKAAIVVRKTSLNLKTNCIDHIDDNRSTHQLIPPSDSDSSLDIHDPAVQTVSDRFLFKNAQSLQWLDYFSRLSTIREVRFDQNFLQRFARYINGQSANIHMLLGYETDFDLRQTSVSQARNILSFHNLQIFEIYYHNAMMNKLDLKLYLDKADANSLRRWLEWRNKLGLRLNRLILVEVVESVSWAHEVFDEVVDELELVDGTVKEHWEADDAGGVEDVVGSDGVE